MVFHKMRSDAFLAVGAFIAACVGGVLPDAISHGIILAGRDGHEALAIIGLFLIVAGLLWFGFSIALFRRFGTARCRFVEVVN